MKVLVTKHILSHADPVNPGQQVRAVVLVDTGQYRSGGRRYYSICGYEESDMFFRENNATFKIRRPLPPPPPSSSSPPATSVDAGVQARVVIVNVTANYS